MSLAKKSVSIFSRDIVFTVIKVITGALIARKLGPTGLGIWTVLELILNYSRAFGTPRFEVASVHFLGKKEYERGEIIFLTNIIAVLSSIFILALFLFNLEFIKTIFYKDVTVDSFLIIVAFSYLPILFITRNYNNFLLSKEDVMSYNISIIINDIANIFLTLVLLFIFDFGLWALAIGKILSGIMAMLYCVHKVHQLEKMKWKINLSLLRRMFKFSYKVYFSEVVGFINLYISNMVTALLLPPALLAFFSMGKGKAEWLHRIADAAGTVIYPRVSNQTAQKIDSVDMTTKAYRLLFITLIGMGFMGVLLIYPATLILYGKEFVPLIYSFYIIIPGIIFHASTRLIRVYLLGIGRPGITLFISIVPFTFQVPLCYLLIPMWGFPGAALAVTTALGITGIITLMIYSRLNKIKYADLLIPQKTDFYFLFGMIKDHIEMIMRFLNGVFQSKQNLGDEL